MGALFFCMGFLTLIAMITTIIEFARCSNPKFRKFLESEGWDV